ncbi:Hcp family type VI secretion system effector [Pseudomonas sp. TNT2022 ID233]|uniref:Hcp family type VI secretion system effector n=1 Tax=Pseudomonas aphyarum TaxID=2942629 RepID=UPI00236124D6|nr:Hcp family type VI secretion system effector [Pseudomonas aphyarum]MDD1136364.1 Hcp family type VI secretion system effector [Pseudomonas aphyarum]
MANHSYMTIEGKTQGLISAGCSTPDTLDNKGQAGHDHEIRVLAFAHNRMNTDKLIHSPVAITKWIDPSSPLLAQALSNREEIDCSVSFYRTSPYGIEEKYFTIKIGGGVIADITLDVPHAIQQNDVAPQERLAIRYRDITWTHHLAGTSSYSFWDAEE